ncbi:MAG: threonine/serine dehydratase [Rhodospirillales bacterium]|nr:threonine/serine dehydratase [Rhodospirillales bacterium]
MTTETAARLPEQTDVKAAAATLEGHAITTALVESQFLNERAGARVLVKAESLQRSGSFKYRGAFNRLSRLDAAARRRGVVAFPRGNHVFGVAAAARDLGIPATIVMANDDPSWKISVCRAYQAEMVLFERKHEDWAELNRRLEALGVRVADERGATIIRPHDDAEVTAGHGTVGLDIVAQARALDAHLDAVLVPCARGGLTAGVALALSAASPDTEIFAVEPVGFDDTARSLAAGALLSNEDGAQSICDGLLSPSQGELNFALNRRLVTGGLVVPDSETLKAMKVAFSDLKLVAEPSGAIGLGAILSGIFDARGKTVCVICSGGNVDSATFRSALETGP